MDIGYVASIFTHFVLYNIEIKMLNKTQNMTYMSFTLFFFLLVLIWIYTSQNF